MKVYLAKWYCNEDSICYYFTTAACSDAKSGIRIWDNDGFICEGFDDKYPTIQGYTDGSICTHKHTPDYVAGSNTGCHSKKSGHLIADENGMPSENFTRYPTQQNDTVWQQGFEDATSVRRRVKLNKFG